MRKLLTVVGVVVAVLALAVGAMLLRPMQTLKMIWPMAEAVAIGEFVGVTTDGVVQPGLFEIAPTGVSTESVAAAAQALLAALSDEQRARVLFPVEDDEWRRWANMHFPPRQGVSFAEMSGPQQGAVWALIAAGLSARGFELARDVTRLEEHLAELMDDHDQYGEHLYWITIMGEPSGTQPWGWQFEGHHLIINFFVLGDQVVMTPTFIGGEPVFAESGKYEGTRILQSEQALGLALINGLTPAQRSEAIIDPNKTGNNNHGEFFQDNAVVPLEGLSLAGLEGDQRRLAERLIRIYVDNLRPEHAEIRMAEIVAHWDDTYFAWVGDTDEDAVFYYRVQSPVVMIEFDHQSPVALSDSPKPTRRHIHTVVRTPNGNDYGKDLLRQHLTQRPH
jgi:hypothetical protein